MLFEVTSEQQEKVRAWLLEVDKKVLEEQRVNMSTDQFARLTRNGTSPYVGALGGRLTYSFTSTNLGVVIVVEEALSGEKLDLTDYGDW